jgi:hypothetical protein
MLAWLRNELSAARSNGERVLVAYHVPPGGFKVNIFTIQIVDNFQMLTEAENDNFVDAFDGFHDVIVGHFVGHCQCALAEICTHTQNWSSVQH